MKAVPKWWHQFARLSLIIVWTALTSFSLLSQTVDSFNPGAGTVYALAIQADDKILVGDNNSLRRLNTDGTRDTTFTAAPTPSPVAGIVVQPDGKIVIGGNFLGPGPGLIYNIARLNSDGSLDGSFHSIIARAYLVSSLIACLALQPDGKILIGGAFTNLVGQAINRIARLNPDGSIDSTFSASITGPSSPFFPVSGAVYSLAVQPDGEILVGGSFTSVNGLTITNFTRLHPNGSVDGTFMGQSTSTIQCLLVQPDGKIVAGTPGVSGFTNHILRFNSDGTRDGTFASAVANETLSLALQTDGKILVAGGSGSPSSRAAYLVRLNTDGSYDTNFNVNLALPVNPLAQTAANALALQADGKIIVAGSFANINNQRRTNIARLNNTSSASQSLTYDGFTLTWLRGGTSPEVWRTTFDASTNGMDWISLGAGTPIAGGWQTSGLGLPTNATFRARGFMTGGHYVGSSWFTETSFGPPAITAQPASRTNNAGTASGFSVQTAGSTPFVFQWFKETTPLTNTGNISGAFTSTLTLSNVFGDDAGAYSIMVSNDLGSITSQVANLTVIDPIITKQPVSVTTNTGQAATFTVTAVGTAPFYQWRKNGSPISGANVALLTLTNLQRADAAIYDVVITNSYGRLTSSVAMLTLNLTTLDSFSAAASTSGSPAVITIALQPDNKLMVGGSFNLLSGQTANNVGRLNTDGTLDPTFHGSADSSVGSLAVQEDGSILLGGSFYYLDGQNFHALGRFNSDGTLDSSFNPNPGSSIGNTINCLLLQPDGHLLAGGAFSFLAGQQQRYLGRLNPDGTLDTSFTPGVTGSFPSFPAIYSVAFQPDGQLIIAGAFYGVSQTALTNLARVDPLGTPDGSFTPNASGPVYCVNVQPDGKILVGGSFTNLAGQGCTNFGRLNTDGTLDTTFTPGATGVVYTIALQTDGAILVGGNFKTLSGQTRSYIGRFRNDGTLDPIFDPEPNSTVNSLLLAPDGKILLGGSFSNLLGQSQKALARLNNTDAAVQSLSFDSSSITWLRSGASPEVWRASFALSTNGADWTYLGDGIRTNGGWQLTGLSLDTRPSALVSIRARGFFSGGIYNGSASFLETYAGRAVIASQPLSRTNNAATPATFSVLAGGTAPLSYQWRKDGLNLLDGGNISGAHTATLSLSNVFGADAGGYSVVVTNSSGSSTSTIATLTVIDPLITTQPSNQWANAGQTVLLSVTAIGTTPLTFQWRKNGSNLPGATTASLTFSNVQPPNIGPYDVLVSNRFGMSTSSVATLAVNLAGADTAFNPQANGGGLLSLLVQPDGKIVAGGAFNSLAGHSQTLALTRLNSDGTVDAAFNSQMTSLSGSLSVRALLLQPDGKIMLGGEFNSVNGTNMNYIARLNPDGTPDPAFTSGASYDVACLALQPDGKILVGGYFGSLGPANRSHLGRLNSDSSLDMSFDPGANGTVNCLVLQTDGKILVGGTFTTLASTPCSNIGRLNNDGSPDLAFNPGASNGVLAIALQADGKILVGGGFTNIAGQPQTNIARLNTDGTLDSGFTPITDGAVATIALQADGKILIGGNFSNVVAVPANQLARLNPDSSRDLTFNPLHTGQVNSLALQPDGKLLVGGVVSNELVRFNNTEPASQNLSFNTSKITWLRGGASPEIWRATFESSTNSLDWTPLGDATRISGGWQLSTPLDTRPSTLFSVRARGSLTGGFFNGSSWFVETTVTTPLISTSDNSFGFRSNRFGFNTYAAAGQVVVIEASTNLVAWLPIQTNVVTDTGLFFLTDPDSPKFRRRFYRARLFTGALPPPNLLSSGSGLGFQAGHFSLNLSAVPGQTVVVEASSNLQSWTPLSTNQLSGAPLYFSDSDSANFRWRFYRARVQ